MADLPYSTLNSLVRAMEPVMADNVLNNVPIVKYLRQHKQGRITKKIEVAVRYATPSMVVWDGTTALSPTTTETYTMAEYDWAHAAIIEKILRTNWLNAEGNPDAVADLAKTTVQGMEDGIGLGLEHELVNHEYTSTTHTFMSLIDIVKATNPTNLSTGLGVLPVLDATWWKANVLAYNSSNGDYRFHMQNVYDSCCLIGSKPDLILTTQTAYEKYLTEGYAKQGFLDTKVTDLGFPEAVPFAGIPVVYSSECTSGVMYFLNSKFLYLWIHPKDFIKISDFEETSTTDLNLLSHVTLTAQLICSARRALGIITGLS